MKFIFGVVLSLLVVQAIAVPFDFLKQEAPVPKLEVDNFPRDMIQMFSRFLSMHDRTLAQLRTLRNNHRETATLYYQTLMQFFGEDISLIQSVAVNYHDEMAVAIIANEGSSPCLEAIQERFDRKVRDVNEAVRGCINNANETMARSMENIFYPVINAIQQEHSLYPFYALVGLSRANVMTDQAQIMDYMTTLFELKEKGWLETVLQTFDWETNRFQVKSDFLLEEMNVCSGTDSVFFLADVMNLIQEIRQCPPPPTLIPPPEE